MIIDGTRAHDRATTLVLDYYAAFNRGDRTAMLALLADDVAHDLNQGARETGRDAFAAFMARMDRCYREQLRDIVVMASPDATANTSPTTRACRRRTGNATCCRAARSSTCAKAGSPE